MKDPCLPNWEVVIWIVRNLRAHSGHGFLYKKLMVTYWQKPLLMLIGQDIENPLMGTALFWEEI